MPPALVGLTCQQWFLVLWLVHHFLNRECDHAFLGREFLALEKNKHSFVARLHSLTLGAISKSPTKCSQSYERFVS